MEVIEQAVEKIKEEMSKESNPYIAYIGNYVLENIEVNKPAAEKIAAGSKTISESFKGSGRGKKNSTKWYCNACRERSNLYSY